MLKDLSSFKKRLKIACSTAKLNLKKAQLSMTKIVQIGCQKERGFIPGEQVLLGFTNATSPEYPSINVPTSYRES